MHESFVSYIWQLQYFDKKDLVTTEGEEIRILKPGILNTDSGPDFSNARIKIGKIDWIGQVEIHIHSSEWFMHHHHQDGAYDNVILHVVWQNDKPVVRKDGTILPTLELRGRVDNKMMLRYRQLITSAFTIPCRYSFASVGQTIKVSMIEKAVVGRIQRKSTEVTEILNQNNHSWEETFYQMLARNFGFKINAEPFFQLARLLPQKILQKHSDKLLQLESLLFGQAGFLEGKKEESYFLSLKREHNLLMKKYSLEQFKMTKSQWKYLRLRPANFPSLRIAQFAALMHDRQNLFSRIISLENLKDLRQVFSVVPSTYWQKHYQFFRASKRSIHEIGQSSVDNIVINTIVPVWVAYANATGDQERIETSLRVLQELPAEENAITRAWSDLGYTPSTSFDSQGLIELYNSFCKQKNCLNCSIGASLIKPTK